MKGVAMREYRQMSLEERKELYVMRKDKAKITAIAKNLNRHKSTIYRDLKRNTVDQRIGYLPDTADLEAKKRKARHKAKISRCATLKEAVITQLKLGWSPEAIAGRMKLQSTLLRSSHETIYQFVYSDEGKRLGLFQYLLRGQEKRRAMHERKIRKSTIPERVSVHDRPAAINTREEFGHLEGDLTFTCGSQSKNIATIVERKTRFTFLLKNETKYTVDVMKNVFNKLAPLPAAARKSITFDNGTEFTRHTLLKHGMHMDTYFCDPHSPWQKGQVEKTNAMIHRYIPKTKSLGLVTHADIAFVEDRLNNTPRKILGFRTPAEMFIEQVNFVALRV